MHQFLKWDFNLQYFSPFNEGLGFFLYFSLFASYVKPSAAYILSLWMLNPFLYFVSFCLSPCGNNHSIWEVDLEVALCLSVVSPVPGKHREAWRFCDTLVQLIFRVGFPRAEWVQEAGNGPGSCSASPRELCRVVLLCLQLVFGIALSSALQ